jgi:outer membrane biosynthesis protein TonB
MPIGSPSPLSAEQIDQLRADVDDGRLPMVWFTPAAVGVDAGRSAKVVAMTEPAEGDFIQVRPTGSHDTLSFSPNELTMDKPPRRRKAAEPEPEPEPNEPTPPVDELLVVRERPTKRTAPKPPPAPEPPAAKPEPAKPKGRVRQPAPITVTLSSNPEGEWTVEVQTGSRRSVRPQPVPAGSVASAAKALGGDIEAAISGAIAAARDQQQARVRQLEAELEAARQALAELAD